MLFDRSERAIREGGFCQVDSERPAWVVERVERYAVAVSPVTDALAEIPALQLIQDSTVGDDATVATVRHLAARADYGRSVLDTGRHSSPAEGEGVA
jgi:hypothetical protein